MKVSDYIVQFLIDKGITDLWGYPGGSVTNLTNSLYKRREEISAHVVYHEQAAGFAACAYSSKNGIPGVAYSTGGPGATNLMTAIGHAYYDSIPVVFLTGNVNTYEAKGNLQVRQRGFQESDIISVSSPLTKISIYADMPEKIRYYLEKAFYYATNGRPGPVLIDLPMNVLRSEVDVDKLEGFAGTKSSNKDNDFKNIVLEALGKADAPCLLLGNALKTSFLQNKTKEAVKHLNIPYLTSMIAFDVIEHNELYGGFVGAYGVRTANFILEKSDLVITLGSRLDQRQVGAIRENFAPHAQIIRVDIDEGELGYKVHDNEISFCMDVKDALDILLSISICKDFGGWINKCNIIKEKLANFDKALPTDYIAELSKYVPENATITTDVGQNMVWVPQAFNVKNDQMFMFSGGMGSMGYALPAAIGACYPRTDNNISVCVCGDGGLQMNIQELQYIFREQIPVKIIVINNYALGMIRYFQEQYFNNVYFQTTMEYGWSVPDFVKVAEAYGIRGHVIMEVNQIQKYKDELIDNKPLLLEMQIREDTYVLPKLDYGKPNYDQQPLLPRELVEELINL